MNGADTLTRALDGVDAILDVLSELDPEGHNAEATALAFELGRVSRRLVNLYAVFLAAFSQQSVGLALGDYGTPMTTPMPKGAAGGRTVPDVPALHRLLRRALLLSKTLPNELLRT